jgi:hypothetical protein
VGTTNPSDGSLANEARPKAAAAPSTDAPLTIPLIFRFVIAVIPAADGLKVEVLI